ncbi:MAG: glycerol-3-phosphate 1-O-acyltransferase PlsY [Nitrospiria bacterium]
MTPPTVTGLAIILIAYIVGTIPFGVGFARWTGAPDPRTKGSGNIGCTNVLRVAGRRAAVLTLLMDALKGAVPVWTALWWVPLGTGWAHAAGIAAVVGHVFPVWSGFRGGKGVATGIGALSALSPITAVVVIVVWAVMLALFRYVSLASVTSAAALPVIAILTGSWWPFPLIAAALIIVRHRDNLLRLRQGTESKLGARTT